MAESIARTSENNENNRSNAGNPSNRNNRSYVLRNCKYIFVKGRYFSPKCETLNKQKYFWFGPNSIEAIIVQAKQKLILSNSTDFNTLTFLHPWAQ